MSDPHGNQPGWGQGQQPAWTPPGQTNPGQPGAGQPGFGQPGSGQTDPGQAGFPGGYTYPGHTDPGPSSTGSTAGQPAPAWDPQQPAAPTWDAQQQAWQGQQPAAPGWQEPPATPPGSKRKLWLVLGAAALVLVVAAGLLVFFLTRGVDPPTGVEAAVTEEGIEVTWQAVEGVASYDVYRNDELLDSTEETTYLDADPPGGTEHRYSVVAVDDGDRSESSPVATALAPVDAPASLSVATAEADVVVEWETVTGADRYEVSRDGEVLADDLTESPYRDVDVPLGDHVYVLTAIDDDGEGSSASIEASIFTRGPWQEAYEIALTFSELISAEPGGQGWEGAVCNPDAVEAAAALIYCEYPNGIYMEVLQFSDAAQRDAKTADIEASADPGASGTWSYGSGPAEGDLFVSPPGAAPPWRYLTFYDPSLELFAIYVDWEGHTPEELRDTWFADAPF